MMRRQPERTEDQSRTPRAVNRQVRRDRSEVRTTEPDADRLASEGGAARLQHRFGNQAVQRLVAAESPSKPDPAAGDPPIQPKLAVGDTDDRYEREAERIAEQVVDDGSERGRRAAVRQSGEAAGRLQRMCARCRRVDRHRAGKPLNCDECEAEFRRAPENGAGGLVLDNGASSTGGDMAAAVRAVGDGGRPLQPSVQSFFEAKLGYDFGGVRVHTGPQADKAARAVNARAFTFGRDVVFRAGAFRPGTDEGARLLAHELTHVIQQSTGRARAGASGPRVQRQPAGPMSSVESYEAFSEPQRAFLRTNTVDPASLDPTSAERMSRLLDAAQQVHQAVQTGDVSGLSLETDAAASVEKTIGSDATEISVTIMTAEGSIHVGRRVDLATGTLTLEFAYQDRDGTRIESTTSGLGPPSILARHTLEGSPVVRGETPWLPPSESEAGGGFREPVPSGAAPPSSEGFGSFLEGAILGDFGENDSWSAIAGQTVVGFIPIVGQIADVRDLLAAFRDVSEGRQGAWLNVTIAGVAFIPGLDFLKGGSRVGRRAVKESAHESITEVSEASLRGTRGRAKESIDEELERSFQRTFTEPEPPAVTRQTGPVFPERAAGFTAAQVRRLPRLLAKPLTEGEIATLGQIWQQTARAGDIAQLSLSNSRRLFDNHRTRFWRAVANDPQARTLLTDAGLMFRNPGTAPFLTLPSGQQIRITIDHIIERQTAPSRALDPSNLRLVFERENTVLLRLLHQLDPFQ